MHMEWMECDVNLLEDVANERATHSAHASFTESEAHGGGDNDMNEVAIISLKWSVHPTLFPTTLRYEIKKSQVLCASLPQATGATGRSIECWGCSSISRLFCP